MFKAKLLLISLFLLIVTHSVQEIPFLSFTSILGNGIVTQQFAAGDQISFSASLLYPTNTVSLNLKIYYQMNTAVDNNVRTLNSAVDNIEVAATGTYYLLCRQFGTLKKLSPILYQIRKNGALIFSKTFETIIQNNLVQNYFLFTVSQLCESRFVIDQSVPSTTLIYKVKDIQNPSRVPVYVSNSLNNNFSLPPAEYVLISVQPISHPSSFGTPVIRRLLTFCDKMCKSYQNILQQPLCSDNCGDGIKSVKEDCDNGNKTGCSKNCVPDPNYRCYGPVGSTSSCVKDAVCGDGIVDLGQECDTGNKTGCSSGCSKGELDIR